MFEVHVNVCVLSYSYLKHFDCRFWYFLSIKEYNWSLYKWSLLQIVWLRVVAIHKVMDFGVMWFWNCEFVYCVSEWVTVIWCNEVLKFWVCVCKICKLACVRESLRLVCEIWLRVVLIHTVMDFGRCHPWMWV